MQDHLDAMQLPLRSGSFARAVTKYRRWLR
jgi:hypothetical protein